MVSTPIHVLKGAALRLIQVSMDKSESPDTAIEEFIGYATKPERTDCSRSKISIQRPFLRKALLSAARSIARLELFVRYGAPRLPIAGYADTAPVNNNNTDNGGGIRASTWWSSMKRA
jgi:hypothetical protein